MESPRVALVASSYLPHLGGVEQHVRSVAAELAARGWHVEVWTVDRGAGMARGEVDGIIVHYLPAPLPSMSPAGIAQWTRQLPAAVSRWWRVARELRPDVLNVQCCGPNLDYALVVSRLRRVPLVVSSHGETFADADRVFDRSVLQRTALRVAGRVAAAVTAVSSAARDDLGRFGIVDPVVVPNGVDPAVDVHDPSAHIDRPLVLAVGRAERVKGFDLLLSAFAVSGLAERARLVVVGDGSQLEPLRAQASSLGLQGSVEFAGALDNEAVRRLIASANVLVVPSRREAFGIVVLEGWAAGVPVVVTDREGPASLVRHEIDALVADPTDAASFGAAMRRVLDDPELATRLARAGRVASERYTWSAVTDRYEALYRRILGPA